MEFLCERDLRRRSALAGLFGDMFSFNCCPFAMPRILAAAAGDGSGRSGTNPRPSPRARCSTL